MSQGPNAAASIQDGAPQRPRRFERAPNHDRRIRRGDDFAGDAWRDLETGSIVYVAVGQHPDPDRPLR